MFQLSERRMSLGAARFITPKKKSAKLFFRILRNSLYFHEACHTKRCFFHRASAAHIHNKYPTLTLGLNSLMCKAWKL